jgi:TatD DNase family protein
VFHGVYHGKRGHEDDLDQVVQRALDIGCSKLMVTGSNVKESGHAIELAQKFPGICYATVGIHPCSTNNFDKSPKGPQSVLSQLRDLAVTGLASGHVVAFGEIGLDYDRLFLAPKETQLKYFEAQLDLAVDLDLPLFLHSRACHADFEALLAPRLPRLPKRGLVHSFTGTLAEMRQLVDMGFSVGVNGCSMKTAENVAVVKEIPLDRLQIETDGPWCEMRASHASATFLHDAPTLGCKAVKKEKWTKGAMVKGRNEPVTIAHVAHAVAGIKGLSVAEVCEA